MIRLYNTRTREKEDFAPIRPDDVRMYVCGPTVYDRAHLGNARPVVVFDVLYRLLRHQYGPDHVRYVRNFTDVDDKIIARAEETGEPIDEITSRTTRWFLDDMGELGALAPDEMPCATDYIPQMVTMIEGLAASGHAYAAEGHVLFRVRSYAAYGALSGRSVDDMRAGARVEVAPYKEDPMDFVLWKPAEPGEPGWPGPVVDGESIGRGRPGWHIECSAMAYELLGETFDIHGGGNDLQFPHHENEIAQSKCAHPEGDFARVWMHNEMLQVEGRKMSKSLGNFFTVRDLLDQGVPGEVIRFVMLSTHYRKPMDWTEKKAREARNLLECYHGAVLKLLPGIVPDVAAPDDDLVNALADDLNTHGALHALRTLFASLDREPWDDPHPQGLEIARSLANSLAFLGLYNPMFAEPTVQVIEPELLARLAEGISRLKIDAMATRDFSEVDRLKSALIEAGVEVRMSKDGVELVPGAGFDPAKLRDLTDE